MYKWLNKWMNELDDANTLLSILFSNTLSIVVLFETMATKFQTHIKRIYGVYLKCFWQISRVSYAHQNKKESSYQHVYKHSVLEVHLDTVFSAF